MLICYPKSEFTLQTEVFFFIKSSPRMVNYVLTRKKGEEGKYVVAISEADENLITIFEKTQILNFRQTYQIEFFTYKIGDLNISHGFSYKDPLNKNFFLDISNPYGNLFKDVQSFSFDVMKNLFPLLSEKNLENYCVCNKEFLKNNEILNEGNVDHCEMLQYVNFILK